ncbi:MAG: hypothetical protein M3R40_13215, partial [Pseudomonadota bacterium]|nr:hypothetical protein [Pseudomonadota bacterium]
LTRLPSFATVLLAVATVLRVLAGYDAADSRLLLVIGSLCWSGAFGLLLFLLLRPAPRPRLAHSHDR